MSTTPAGPTQDLFSGVLRRAASIELGIPELGADAAALRRLATRLSGHLDEGSDGVGAGQLAAHSVLQAALVRAVSVYHEQLRPGALVTAASAVLKSMAARGEHPDEALGRIASRYASGALDDDTAGRTSMLLVLGALLDNPALGEQAFLLADPCVGPGTDSRRLLDALRAELDRLGPIPGVDISLPALLGAPAEAAPDSLGDQLEFVLAHWPSILTEELERELLRARDLLAEETATRVGGAGPAEVLTFGGSTSQSTTHGGSDEPGRAQFSEDRPWMPNLVLMAKQALVWLDQLSRQHGRSLTRLDQIPDSELDTLALQGFTGLWLIGLWERSDASREIKRRCGNPEAEPSAYALHDYVIAERLGGEAAYLDLAARARARGIRLAADMVPNHVGIDGRWVIEHPEWFVQTGSPPFEGYRFEGPDLSTDDRVSIRIEDGYWSRTDAAVVFQRIDARTAEARYIYHGNDGTQMAWNDTAQLDYLNPGVREAVISTILSVARQFQVIRFDAAMTLARKHVRRLWHPAPGSGGAIPSRAERAASPEDFDAAMPREFWREVVERVRDEVPDTLLLAEAFWMMEGYFVRDLGMHRVYNSAFMHMLRDEDNAGYRQSIRNVLEYSPAILERFVNFMNNPDEETAVAQFGKGDKYFGICTLMATMPGLPMFGHGQIEGFSEKYGMEFSRAYADEQPDEGFVEHHRRVIFPLLQRRHLFSGVEHFALFDLVRSDGSTDEAVFAYCNRSSDGLDRSLVIYNNVGTTTQGRLQHSTDINEAPPDDPTDLRSRPLSDALGLVRDSNVLYGLQDLRTGRWILRAGSDLADRGLWVSLQGYGCHVFVGFREIVDHDGSWRRLAARLDGGDVADLDVARAEQIAPPVDEPTTAPQTATVVPEASSISPDDSDSEEMR